MPDPMEFPESWAGSDQPAEVAPRTWFVSMFSGVSAFETDEGLVLVDSGLPQLAPLLHAAIRGKTSAKLHTVVFTHGHVDHAYGLAPWLAELEELGAGRPRVVAHRAVLERFRRYGRMREQNERVNRVQFAVDAFEWPEPPILPDVVYDDRLELVVGGEAFVLEHGRGETDDATFVWVPGRRVLVSGDFVIGCAPNCGNPQKVQRYAEDWKRALEAMVKLGADVLLPGHGPAILGSGAIQEVLADTARYLGLIVAHTLAGLNAGTRPDEIVSSITLPADLVAKPWLAPLYDRPEFIARNVLRLHGGWWDGHPANLLPSPAESRAREIACLAGGVDALVARARALLETDLPLACHLAEWSRLAAPDDFGANEVVRDCFRLRATREPSQMARAIFTEAAREADAFLSSRPTQP